MYYFTERFSFYKVLFISLLLVSLYSCNTQKGAAKSNPKENKTKENKHADVNLKLKYAKLLAVNESDISNTKLYSFVDEWYGVPYKFGGKTKTGIDCSGFVSNLYTTVYNTPLQGTAESMFYQCKAIAKDKLQEGDLVFFKIEHDNISHIGVYLQNNKFVHASTKKGIMIDDLDEAYYKKYFYKAGKVKR
jgi:lipoprotein Spr